ncbi:MAG: S8 family serine peptidase, partial [Schleiferiaceae bacterium]|nr:S8 family serine peptidase [Schleiferiaceae bacterium]
MKKHYGLIFLLLLGFMTNAQENNYNIWLASKTIQLPPTLNQEKFINNETPVQGHYYRLIQFQNTLFPKDFDYLRQLGVELQDYIPHKTYIAKFPENFSVTALRSDMVRTIAPLQPEWKLAKNLYLGDIPEWANHGNGQMEAVVIPFGGMAMSQFVSDLELSGVRLRVVSVRDEAVDIHIAINDIEKLAAISSIKHIHAGEDPGDPENDGARRSARVSLVNTRYGIADRYDGSGVLISLGDDGDIGPHIDYQGRLTSVAGPSNGDHGDHVAGTIFGAGNRDPRGQGMAPGVDMRYYSYPANLNNANADYSTFGVRITSSSYSNGCNAGYTSFARNLDLGTFTNEKLLHVFSAGNSGTSNCGYGAGAGWGNITGGHKIGKNVIAVANIQKNDLIAGSSSRGPAHDGRIKPEIGAVGTSVFSTTDPHIYTTKTGTSMSCPGVSGSLSLIYQAYKQMHNGEDPDAGLAKAILLNTADDMGNAGPDFIFGFGKMHVARALDAVEDSTFIIDQLATGQTKTHTVSVPANVAQVKVMLYWTDPPASVSASRALVNDLDMTVTSNGVTFQPWVLDPTPIATNLNSVATRATDTLNNVEQVTIDNPTAGDLTISVTGTVNVGTNQKFYLVYTFIMEEIKIVFPAGGEKMVTNETAEVRWDAHNGTGTFQVQYSVNNGQTWTTIGNAGANARRIAWSIPNIPTGRALVRVTRAGVTATSETNFSIAGVPANLSLDYACPDSIGISWNPVQGADSYRIYVLGNKYMDSVDVTTASNYVFFNQNPSNEMWISVAALGPNNMQGRRAVAIFKPSGLTNCIVQKDLSMEALLSPAPGMFPDCQIMASASLSVAVANIGVDTIFSA